MAPPCLQPTTGLLAALAAAEDCANSYTPTVGIQQSAGAEDAAGGADRSRASALLTVLHPLPIAHGASLAANWGVQLCTPSDGDDDCEAFLQARPHVAAPQWHPDQRCRRCLTWRCGRASRQAAAWHMSAVLNPSRRTRQREMRAVLPAWHGLPQTWVTPAQQAKPAAGPAAAALHL